VLSGANYGVYSKGRMTDKVRPSHEGLPFPESLCHRCAAAARYIRTATSMFILCPLVPNKYPPQPVLSCPLFQPAEGEQGHDRKLYSDDFPEKDGGI
jgi:hypothetical protein